MSVSKLISVMMQYYNDVRLSEHSVKAYAYAHGIGKGENLPESDQFILSAAAVLHDIGIPPAIKLYGSAKAEFQEKEGALLVPEMLEKAGIIQAHIKERVSWLVGHHHTEELAENNLLLQILIEADYLVNLAEGNAPAEKTEQVLNSSFKTRTGKEYIKALFGFK